MNCEVFSEKVTKSDKEFTAIETEFQMRGVIEDNSKTFFFLFLK